MDIHFPARLIGQKDGTLLVEFPDLPGAVTYGRTLNEAASNAREALSAYLSSMIKHGEPIPAPGSRRRGRGVMLLITPDAKTQAALLIREARGERTIADLATALETSWPSAKRLEDPEHWPSLRTLDRAAEALGLRLVLRLERPWPDAEEAEAAERPPEGALSRG